MNKDILPIISLWKEEACKHIKQYMPYHASDQLKRMAALFSPGLFYCYILNFHNLEMEYVHPGTKEVLGLEPEEVTIARLLEALPPEELIMMQKKEALASDFLFRFLSPSEILNFKVVYFLRMQDVEGKEHNILHQATALTVSDTGKVEHVLGVQTDVSHLGVIKNDNVSLVNLKGGTSYFNLDPEKGRFSPEDCNNNMPNLSDVLTKRELEIIKLVATGLSSERIADELVVSPHTVQTHRKKILKKTGCANTSELVAKCLVEGLV